MKKILVYSFVAGGLLVMSSCNGKMGQFKSEYFSTNPNPLEVVGQEVPAVVTANIPAKFFKKNAQVTITPVLVYGSTENAAAPMMLQGEKVRGNAPVVSYNNGGAVTIPVNYFYNPEMMKSELYLTFNVTQGSKQYALPKVKVADGVIATAALADAGTVNPATANDAFQRVINEKYSADIRFLINQANIRQNQLGTKEMGELQNKIRGTKDDANLVLNEINIQSYASPEGALDFNARLAENREKNTQQYLDKQLKKDKITEFGELTAQFTAEDWEGFQKLVAASDIQDKDLILSVLSQFKDPEVREREIRNLSSVFEVLADEILPQLRYSRITASIDVIGKSDEEINKLFDTDPSQLSVEELLYAATLTNDNARKQKIYETAVKLYPNDFRGYNNLGKVQYINKDYTSALANLQKAAQLAPNSSEVAMNQGLVSLVNKDFSAAKNSFSNAAGLDGLGDALGVYYLSQGDNAAAVKAFGASKTNNAALAQILTKDYASAKNTLNAISTPDATTYYLMAVLGARTNNASMVNSNLQKAIQLDPTLAAKAQNDLEFANFAK
jgi:hypothetical protein